MLEVHVLHQMRRAPFGRGKFWKEFKESLVIFLQNASDRHPLFATFAEAIASDYGQSPLSIADDPNALRQLLWKMVSLPIGEKVQWRRWYTIHKAGPLIDKLWHSLLLSIMCYFAMDGIDPWQLVVTVPAISRKDDDKAVRNFKFKHQALRILMNGINQRILRSSLVVFERIYTHHVEFTKAATDVDKCFQFVLQWGDKTEWVRSMLIGTLKDP